MIPVRYTLRAKIGSFFGQKVWEDITGYVDFDNAAMTVDRGSQAAASQPSPTRLTVPLVNDDGRFTPWRPSSPYFPHVLDGADVELTALVPVGKNLEGNASGALGVGGWEGGGSASPLIQQSTGHVYPDGGAWAILLTWPTTAGDSAAQKLIRGLVVGERYTVSRQVWVPTGSPDVRLRVNGGFIATGATVTTKDAFATASVTFTAFAPTANVDVHVTAAPTGGQCWVDAGQVEDGNSATTPGPSAILLERFYGQTLEWPTGGWAGAALTASTQLIALGVTAQLDERARDVKPFVVEEALLDSPLVYLPLDESDGATQAGNLGSEPRPAELLQQGGTGTAEFGAGTGPPSDGSSSLVLTRGSAFSGFYLRAAAPLFAASLTVEAFIATTTADQQILNPAVPFLGDPGLGLGMTVRLNSLGRLEWRSNGTLVVTSPGSIADGQTHHIAVTYSTGFVTTSVVMYVDGVQVASGSIASNRTYVSCNWLLVGSPKLGMYNGTINHVGLYPTALTADRILAHAQAGLTGFGGERSEQRISRLAAYARLSSLTPALRPGVWVLDSSTASVLDSSTVLAATDLDIDTGSATVWGQAAGGFKPLAGMRDVAATEGGTVLEDRAGFLQFQSRSARYNRAPTVRIDLADGDVQPDLGLGYDDQDVVNDATVTTQDGAKFRFVDQVSVDQRGTYDGGDQQLLTRDAADAYAAAAWQVRRYSEPRPAYRSVTVDLTAAPADLALQVLRTDVGDRLDLVGLPSQAPWPSAQLFPEGYTESIRDDELTVSFNTSAAEGYQVWVLDNPVLSVLDETTMLAW